MRPGPAAPLEVARLIRLTAGHAVEPGDRLGALLVSIDLSILGVPAVEYAEGKVSATRVRLSDFVPNTDDYLRRVAGAARQLLRGESPGRVF